MRTDLKILKNGCMLFMMKKGFSIFESTEENIKIFCINYFED